MKKITSDVIITSKGKTITAATDGRTFAIKRGVAGLYEQGLVFQSKEEVEAAILGLTRLLEVAK